MAEFIRQQAIINQPKLEQLKIAIVGAGSIGSFTALALTKMGVQHLALWDVDIVELHNVSNQFFTREALETAKVHAVKTECERYTPNEIHVDCFNEYYIGQPLDDYNVIIALTDNIEGRRDAFEAAQKSAKAHLFLDGRMGAELFRCFAFDPKNAGQCKEYFDDYITGVANEELPCTARTIIYNVLMASSMLTSYVKKFVNGEEMPFQFLFDFNGYRMSKTKMEST